MQIDVPVAVDALPTLAPTSDAASRALQDRGWQVVTGLRMEHPAVPAPFPLPAREPDFALWLVSPDGFVWAGVPVTDDGPLVQLVSLLDNGAAVVTGFEDDLYMLERAWPEGGAYAETIDGEDLDALVAGHADALAAASSTEGAAPVAEAGAAGVIIARRVWARLSIQGARMAGLRSLLPAKKRATDPRWIAGHARVPIAELRQTPTVPCDVVGGFTPWQ
jgi:hypothetical protein